MQRRPVGTPKEGKQSLNKIKKPIQHIKNELNKKNDQGWVRLKRG